MQSACTVFYCHLWPVRLYHVFTHYLIDVTILGNNVMEHKICILDFSINLSERFLILRRIQRSSIINIQMFSCKVSCQILIKLEFSRKIFEKILKYQISWKSFQREPRWSTWNDGRTEGQTDRRHGAANCRFSQFCESILKCVLAHRNLVGLTYLFVQMIMMMMMMMMMMI